jgi:hypothetical protein
MNGLFVARIRSFRPSIHQGERYLYDRLWQIREQAVDSLTHRR